MISEANILAARILIVDDEAAAVSLLNRMLRGAGDTQVSATLNPLEVCELHRTLWQVMNERDAAQVGQKLIDAVSRPFHLDGKLVELTASVGIALFPSVAEDSESLLKGADRRRKTEAGVAVVSAQPIR